ncbi:MAG: ankyrin repeat domain-containing RING finger protein [Candidatus Babeliales bacterium]|jgi:hypothetical protein
MNQKFYTFKILILFALLNFDLFAMQESDEHSESTDTQVTQRQIQREIQQRWTDFYYSDDDFDPSDDEADLGSESKHVLQHRAEVTVGFSDGLGYLSTTSSRSFKRKYSKDNRPIDIFLLNEIQTQTKKDCLYFTAIIEAGANPNACIIKRSSETSSEYLLKTAVSIQNSGATEALIIKGADVNAADENGDTALYSAVYSGNYHITRLLLENGANPNMQDKNKCTPLISVFYPIRSNLIQLLLSYGADPTIQNSYGQSAIYILKNKYPDYLFTLYLMEHIANNPKCFEDCPICLNKKFLVPWPGCNHKLCIKCMVEWHNSDCLNGNTCPFCRKPINVVDPMRINFIF